MKNPNRSPRLKQMVFEGIMEFLDKEQVDIANNGPESKHTTETLVRKLLGM